MRGMAPTPAAPLPPLRSMTGFGRADVDGQTVSLIVEARSVNHRHLDVALRLPRALAAFEEAARRLIQRPLERGRVDVSVPLGPAAGAPTQQVSVDQALAAEYVARARELGRAVGVPGDVTLAWVLERPGVVRLEEADAPAPEALWPLAWAPAESTLTRLVVPR